MKNIYKVLVLLVLLVSLIIYNEQITNFIIQSFIMPKEIYLDKQNEYSLNYNINYVNKTNEFVAYKKEDLINIIYTALDNGYDKFYFLCKYDDCEEDVQKIKYSEEFMDINNFVHPYNTYNHLYISINLFGKVNVIVEKNYSKEEIAIINNEIEKILKNITTNDMTDKQKIKAFHDHIINNTRYDFEYVDNNLNDINHPSHKAIGPILYHKALCGGYTDITSIFLNKLKIPNYKIASKTHIWNLVYLNNKWYHLDLTWNEPSSQEDKPNHIFFLIDTEELQNLKTGYHDFDKNRYLEANQIRKW